MLNSFIKEIKNKVNLMMTCDETSPETKQRQSCFQAYDNTGFYPHKAERSITDGQSHGG